MKSKVYALPDSQNRILRIEGGYTIGNISNISEWILIDEGYGDKYNLCQSHYLDNLYTEDGIPLYKLEDNKPILRTTEEIEIDKTQIPTPEPVVSVEERVSKLEAENEELKATNIALNDELVNTQLALCDVYEMMVASTGA